MSGIGSSDDEEFKRVVGDMLSAAELDQTRQVRVLELAAMLYVVVLAHSDVQISAACKCQICVLHAQVMRVQPLVSLRRMQMVGTQVDQRAHMLEHSPACLQIVEQHL